MVDRSSQLVNFAVLFDKRSRATDVSIGGVRLGEDAGALRGVPLSQASPNDSEPYVCRAGRVFRVRTDGTAAELTQLDELVEATFQVGGHLRTEGITWRVSARGILEWVSIYGAALHDLDIGSEPQVEGRLGSSDRFEHMSLGIKYHYESRGFSVTWDPRDNKVSFVILGIEPWTPPQLSGADLAQQLVEGWKHLAQYAWREPPASDLPAQLRYRRVNALVRAFALPSLEAATDGRFLDAVDPARWSELVRELANATDLGRAHEVFPDLQLLYQNLLAYRRKAEDVLAHNAGWLECGEPTLLGLLHTTERINQDLRERLALIDRMLGQLLDPTLRRVDQRTLMREFGYVDADLQAVDAWDAWGF